jgi:hypothetical protein
MVNDMEADATALKDDLKDLNGELKGVLGKMREPGKLCMDVLLSVILAIAIGILVGVVKYYFEVTKQKSETT